MPRGWMPSWIGTGDGELEKPLTAILQPDGMPLDVAGYERAGGYQALRKALTMTPDAIIDEVKRSKLRGRGGGGFSTGRKWEAVPRGPDAPASVISLSTPMRWSPAASRTGCCSNRRRTR